MKDLRYGRDMWRGRKRADGMQQLAGGACLALALPVQDALHPAGIQAGLILQLWHCTLLLCLLVFVAVLVFFALALWRPAARRASARSAPELAPAADGERRLHRAVGWSALLSGAGLLVLLAGDMLTGHALAQLPADGALRIELTGHDWWWDARYDDPQSGRHFRTANELHLPVGRAAIITLRSDDVIHTLWVPNLHGKLDLIPGRSAELRLRADRAGTYRGQCAEFCGSEHAMMALLVVAEAPAAYAAWAAGQQRGAATPVTAAALRGRQVLLENNCAQCHALQGTPAGGQAGPDLTHLASRQTIAAGMLPNRRGQLAGWIVDAPALKPGVMMPPNPLAPDDLQALLAYLESLR
jgi:cytochrome c oxidase subunit 2